MTDSNHFVHRNLPMQLLQARESVMRYFRRNLKTLGLTEQQWRVLRVLDEHGELETLRIAEEAFILAPSLSGVLERMERDGLIVRHRISSDQRKVLVDLTDKSRELVRESSRFVEDQYRLLEENLGPATLASLQILLDQLIALPGPDAAGSIVVRKKLAPRQAKTGSS